ncbi:MAG: Rne/Rng family ribonuclease [Geminicoccaceae bacterium]|nr:Rne/Rng family ribonuclease [Geminicoccaceae bacterium]
MTKRMLIDAAHAEETRVVVVDDGELLDFDFESSTKRQIKGNIYLAKVTRVEPSLQAAFVDYGGNRHGFLPFSEIHPDYYQIPQADREMLERLEREAQAKLAAEAESEGNGAAGGEGPQAVTQDAEEETADVLEELARRRAKLLRSYKIQEVIKRRQIMLVQVVKEERGTKGAALTTYLSLAGRYCVLMPNTPRGGGISRKIVDPADRRRLKAIAAELDVPPGMGLIIRTAGAERSKAEIKRDYEYLLRLWNEIRETTLKSVAPCLIHEESDLVRRALRDLYTRDIEEVLVEGEAAYRNAKRFMQMLMPSRARQIKLYEDEVPLFFRYKVEEQLDKMYRPVVTLPSGGSIVIHTTEALTAIDVNSGRATRERHIDETALKTNLEAADEIARQLRLRDIAGLVVVDFIDMAEHRHQRQVEKRLKDALKLDRARIQLGRISPFGLLELSRQRLRPSLLELSTQICPHCEGAGVVRSTESCALQALRLIQDAGIKREARVLKLTVPPEVAWYLLNKKREVLVRLEQRYDLRVDVQPSERPGPPKVELEVVEKREEAAEAPAEAPAAAEPAQPAAERPAEPARAAAEAAAEEAPKRRRRRRRRRRRTVEAEAASAAARAVGAAPEPVAQSASSAVAEAPEAAATAASAGEGPAPEERAEAVATPAPPVASAPVAEAETAAAPEPQAVAPSEEGAAAQPRTRRRRRVRAARAPEEAPAFAPIAPSAAAAAAEVGAAPVPSPEAGAPVAAAAPAEPVAESTPEPGPRAEAAAASVPEGAGATPGAEAESGRPVETAAPAPAIDGAPREVLEAALAVEPAPAREGAEAAASGEPQTASGEGGAQTPPSPPRPPRQGWWSRWVKSG